MGEALEGNTDMAEILRFVREGDPVTPGTGGLGASSPLLQPFQRAAKLGGEGVLCSELFPQCSNTSMVDVRNILAWTGHHLMWSDRPDTWLKLRSVAERKGMHVERIVARRTPVEALFLPKLGKWLRDRSLSGFCQGFWHRVILALVIRCRHIWRQKADKFHARNHLSNFGKRGFSWSYFVGHMPKLGIFCLQVKHLFFLSSRSNNSAPITCSVCNSCFLIGLTHKYKLMHSGTLYYGHSKQLSEWLSRRFVVMFKRQYISLVSTF